MAVIKPFSRRRHRDATHVSWPNNIPQRPRGSSSRILTPAFHSRRAGSKHRTYHARKSSASSHSPEKHPSAQAFRPIGWDTRPPNRPVCRKPVPRKGPKNVPGQQANPAKQTLKEKRDNSEDSFDTAMKKYNNAYEKRLHELRKWVNLKHAEHRIDFGVKKELNAYFGKRKFGDRPSAKVLSKYACQALELSEHDLGTDLAWAKGETWMFGERWGHVFEKMIEGKMGEDGYGVCGPGYVGEEDLESWAGDTEYWEGEQWDGRKADVDGLGENVEGSEVERIQDIEEGMFRRDVEQADVLDNDEAEGLQLLDDMGNIPTNEKHHGLEEAMDIEVDLNL